MPFDHHHIYQTPRMLAVPNASRRILRFVFAGPYSQQSAML